MTRDEMIAARLEAALLALAGREDKGDDRDTLRRRIESAVDMELRRLADVDAIRDQSTPEYEDSLKDCGSRESPVRVSTGNACGGGRRVIRDGRTH